jgi:PST family polysaccharide transporter
VSSIIVGLRWGIIGVAASFSMTSFFVKTPLLFWFICRKGPITAADIYRVLFPIFSASVASFIILVFLRYHFQFSDPLIGILISIVLTIVVSLGVLYFFPSGKQTIMGLKELLELILKKENNSA